MFIHVGTTRVVLLFGPLAIKFARPHSGISSNLLEYRLSQQCPRLPFARTARTFYGLVNIQRRGRKVSRKDVASNIHPLGQFLSRFPPFHDLQSHRNLCWIKGKMVICDYGMLELEPMFVECATHL